MPELPEVDAITGVVRKYARGNSIVDFEIVRWNGRYFDGPDGPLIGPKQCGGRWDVDDVFRLGKRIVFRILSPRPLYLIAHNAMTGYFDWEHEPWTFDYVEADREPDRNDIRVKIRFGDGKVLQFHDVRLFGSMKVVSELPTAPPELLSTPNGMPSHPVMSPSEFYEGLKVKTPIKVRLMDQRFIGGIGNIYSVEALHAAGIHPSARSNRLSSEEARVLHAALIWSVDHSIPQVRYDWLNVYRRASCGTCGLPVKRYILCGRATFVCEGCQPNDG
jgi:formamidopyrimidine-DNA glycosylase